MRRGSNRIHVFGLATAPGDALGAAPVAAETGGESMRLVGVEVGGMILDGDCGPQQLH